MAKPAAMAQRTQIMAILNVTPDSFSDGGRLSHVDAILAAAEAALDAGADILDIGGESTRPGAKAVSVDVELKRVLPAIEAIRQRFSQARISVDTRKAKVAELALQAGASIVNDVSGLQFDCRMLSVLQRFDAQLVLMHSQGTPEDMQRNPVYPGGVVEAVFDFFTGQLQTLEAAGIAKSRVILDPGFGFGKTLGHNLSLLKHLARFQELGCPVLVGTSRKSFLTLGGSDIPPAEREALTAASLALAIERGAAYVRVHNVAMLAPVVRLSSAVLQAD
jgi:dihydropteroate synthase